MKSLPKMVLAALFTGLMVAGAPLVIPVGEVPMVIANAFPWLAGLLLGPLWGGISAGLYLLLGAFGLPVFAKGASGAALLGPTGGFLIGYVLAAILVGFLRDPEGKSLVRNGLATGSGLLVAYLAGIPWLAFVLFKGFAGFEPANLVQAFFWSTGPATFPLLFVIGDVVKAVAVVAVAAILVRLPGVAPLLKSR